MKKLHTRHIFESPKSNHRLNLELDKSRLPLLQIGFISCVAILVIRLFFLQIIQGKQMRGQSDSNRVLLRQLEPARGVIKDRNGTLLVLNQPIPQLLFDENKVLLFEPKTLTREEALQIEASGSGQLTESAGRLYPFGPYTAHVLGYVGEASPVELKPGEVQVGQLVGKSGLEKQYDDILRGQAGSELIEVNANGQLVRRVGQKAPVSGVDLQLGVDMGLTEKLTQLLGGRKGAVVATNPQTGEVLALVSSPTFDNNLFSGSDVDIALREAWEQQLVGFKNDYIVADVFSRDDQPLINRAISGTYPPGSVYKVVPSIAGLEEAVITGTTQVDDTGVITIDSYRFGNWYFLKYGKTEGLVNVITALKRSNDIYYYKLGEWLGPEQLVKWSEIFGLGRVSGIDIPGEKPGLVPSPIWKERVKGERWFLGNTYHMSIGQGDLLVTPVQIHQMMAVIANGGRLCTPRLVISKGDQQQEQVQCQQLDIQENYLALVREGLIQACQQGGTAFPFFNFDLSVFGQTYAQEGRNRVACKTGTAEHFGGEVLPHAWFSVFAPAINPEIQITVLLEAAGEGSEQAAPVAKEALEYWFTHQPRD